MKRLQAPLIFSLELVSTLNGSRPYSSQTQDLCFIEWNEQEFSIDVNISVTFDINCGSSYSGPLWMFDGIHTLLWWHQTFRLKRYGTVFLGKEARMSDTIIVFPLRCFRVSMINFAPIDRSHYFRSTFEFEFHSQWLNSFDVLQVFVRYESVLVPSVSCSWKYKSLWSVLPLVIIHRKVTPKCAWKYE